jgi:hypothetical protein
LDAATRRPALAGYLGGGTPGSKPDGGLATSPGSRLKCVFALSAGGGLKLLLFQAVALVVVAAQPAGRLSAMDDRVAPGDVILPGHLLGCHQPDGAAARLSR